MDADGFTIVRHSAGSAGAAAGGAGDGGGSGSALVESDNAKRKKKRGSIVVSNFYRFQRQDAKMDREFLPLCCLVTVRVRVGRTPRWTVS